METTKFLCICLIIVCILMVGSAIGLIIHSFREERKANDFRKKIKPGDEVRITKEVKGKIDSINDNDDTVIVKVKVNKRWVYPLKENE